MSYEERRSFKENKKGYWEGSEKGKRNYVLIVSKINNLKMKRHIIEREDS